MFIDEAGTARHTPYFAVGVLKIGVELGHLVNELEILKGKSGIRNEEIKFSGTKNSNLEYHKALVDAVHATKARFSAVIVDRSNDPKRVAQWQSQAYYTIEAIKFAMSEDERTSAIVDHINVPRDVNYEHFIQKGINKAYDTGDTRLISVIRMASEACWGLQLADVLTGSVHFSHRVKAGTGEVNPESTRGQLAEHVRSVFNVPSLHTASSPRFKVREKFKSRHHDTDVH